MGLHRAHLLWRELRIDVTVQSVFLFFTPHWLLAPSLTMPFAAPLAPATIATSRSLSVSPALRSSPDRTSLPLRSAAALLSAPSAARQLLSAWSVRSSAPARWSREFRSLTFAALRS